MKEDVYISYYVPDNKFNDKIPFVDYVLVRAENIYANYLRNKKVESITPNLLKILTKNEYNVIYLPRYPEDKLYADGLQNIYIPDSPLDGLDLCYFSNGVITGAGTLAREAACLGIPAFSFFAGMKLLAVDKKLITERKVYYSRDPQDLVRELKSTRRTTLDLSKSINVREEIKE